MKYVKQFLKNLFKNLVSGNITPQTPVDGLQKNISDMSEMKCDERKGFFPDYFVPRIHPFLS